MIGCGAVAAINHLPALAVASRARATALVDAVPERAAALARRWGVPRVAADWRDVLGEIDAAIVTLPNSLHAPVAVDLLSRGVHVLVEKPMALSTAECDAMIAAAEGSGAVLAVGLDFRFIDGTRLVRDLLASGVLGRLRGFDLRQGVIPRWPFATDYLLRRETAGGGVLVDFGVHVLDLLLWWLGDWAEVEYRDDAAGGIESDCELALAMTSGVSGTVEISRTRNLRNTCRFEGERGTLEAEFWDPEPVVELRVEGSGLSLSGRARRAGPRTPAAAADFRELFRRQADDFAGAILDRREPWVPGREGRRSVALIEACYAVRRPLELPWTIQPRTAGRP